MTGSRPGGELCRCGRTGAEGGGVDLFEQDRAPASAALFPQFFGDQDRESREEGLGSGVIVSPNGYILTNNHVVEGADELKVALADDREFKGKIIGTDPKTDVAVIKIEADNLPAITLADSDRLRVGDVVFAVGNPLDVGQTVTTGIVSAKGRRVHLLDDVNGYEDFIQTDAAINLGNSGGALVDAKGPPGGHQQRDHVDHQRQHGHRLRRPDQSRLERDAEPDRDRHGRARLSGRRGRSAHRRNWPRRWARTPREW